jgi:hypothetical protein
MVPIEGLVPIPVSAVKWAAAVTEALVVTVVIALLVALIALIALIALVALVVAEVIVALVVIAMHRVREWCCCIRAG